ncbi:MAG: hypothetical protein ACI3Y0_13415 [Prevotella sp.]
MEKYKMGGSTKHVCPNCDRRKRFTRYVDLSTGKYVDEYSNVAKCGRDAHTPSPCR